MWTCQMCGGPVMLLGQLGNLEHGTCRNCGMPCSREAQPHDWNGDEGEEPCPCQQCFDKRRQLYLDWCEGNGLPERR